MSKSKTASVVHPVDMQSHASLLSRLSRPTNSAALLAALFAWRPQLARVDDVIKLLPSDSVLVQAVGEETVRHTLAALTGAAVGYGGTVLADKARQALIRQLLTYVGWIYEPKSTKTKLWGWLLKQLMGTSPRGTFGLQALLPKLPLPSLNDTLDKWLEAARQLETDEQFAVTRQVVEEFRLGEGPRLQQVLLKKAQSSDNWLSDYWKNAVYLSSREPLLVNSNYAGTNGVDHSFTTDQLARAASNIRLYAEYAEKIRTESLPPVTVQGVVPFCMDGYKYLFRMTRIPGEYMDSIRLYPHSEHIVVIRKGHYFKLNLFDVDSSLLTYEEIKIQLKKICDEAENLPDEPAVAVLTSQNRTLWSQQRKVLMDKNPEVLETVESAMFIYVIDTLAPKDTDEFAKAVITGRGNDRWFDKSVTSVMFADSRYSGSNMEHSVLDAMVFGTMGEWVMFKEAYENGDVCKSSYPPPRTLAPPSRLTWDVSGLEKAIDDAMKVFTMTEASLDVRCLSADYGMGFPKQCKLSPDGYIQMALQLAYYRLHHETPRTYEPATLRLFILGRTETINPISADSVAWVKAMLDPAASIASRRQLLSKAVEHQRTNRLDATVGRGCDRHLLALMCASRELGMDMPKIFTDSVWQLPFKLSSSQTPTNIYNYRQDIDWPLVMGGFGPACYDGYGVCYVFFGENLINFYISNWRSSGVTDSGKFVQSLQQALTDMKQMLSN